MVVIDRNAYIQAVDQILSDTTKFKKLERDPTLSREGQLQRFLRKLKNDGYIDSEHYNNIYPTGSQPARMYGLPKIHKQPTGATTIPPFRPIVSSIGTYNYQPAKYLCNLLKPHIPDGYTLQDSFSFVSELKGLSLHGKFLVSFDITSLFTNIPLEESIDLAVKYIKDNNTNLQIPSQSLKRLFKFATAETHLLFNGKYFDQIDGIAMGSPLAPVLANLFMGHHERQWLAMYTGIEPSYYRRYVDDTFCVFNNENEANKFFDYLNTRHANIKFTMEKQCQDKLPFLDVTVDTSNPLETHTFVFHKKTYTGLLTNFHSFIPLRYKLGLINTLLDRAFKINNTWTGFHNSIGAIKDTLKRNLFPGPMIDRCVESFFQKINNDQHVADNVQKAEVKYFKLPFVGIYSRIAAKRISVLCKKFCPDKNFKLAFSTYKIGRFF